MCWSRNSKTLSWLGIVWGLLSLATLLTAFLSNVWLYTKEPIQFPNSDILTTVTFKIGLWRICPTLKLSNTTTLHKQHLSCISIKYSSWEDITATDLGILTPLEFTPSFLSKMRISTLFGAVSIVLIFLATTFALVGLCNSDHKTIVACGLFILGGLTLGGGLLIFASVLSDAYFERPKRPQGITGAFEKLAPSGLFDYKYGWSFFAAGAAFFMTELAAVLCISAYVRRFPTVEDMVRIMVPGAERRLKKHHELSGEYLVQHKNKYRRQDMDASVTLSGSKCKNKILTERDTEGVGGDGAMFMNKPAPDICTSNPTAKGIISFRSPPASSVLMASSGAYCPNPENSYILSEISSMGADSVLSNSSLRGSLAGHTVPILLMHPPQRSSGGSFMFSTLNEDCKKNFKMSALPLNENHMKTDTVVLPPKQLSNGVDGEMSCFDQSFYSNQPNEFEYHLKDVDLGLKHHSLEIRKGNSSFFGTFQGDRACTKAGTVDRSADIPGAAISTNSPTLGTGSGATATVYSFQSNLSKKKDVILREKETKSLTTGSNAEKFDSDRTDVRSFEFKNDLG